MTQPPQALRLLLVEDEFFLAQDLAGSLAALGAAVLGPVPTVDRALQLIEADDPIDYALVDLNLRGQLAYPVADALMQRGVPFAFVTGYDASAIPERYSQIERFEKPLDAVRVAKMLFRI